MSKADSITSSNVAGLIIVKNSTNLWDKKFIYFLIIVQVGVFLNESTCLYIFLNQIVYLNMFKLTLFVTQKEGRGFCF